MLSGDSKFSKSERRMARHEFMSGITYLTADDLKNARTECSDIFSRKPTFVSLPTPLDKEKLEEALKSFEVTPKE